MKTSTHSILRAGLSLLTVSAVAIALSVQPAPPPRPAPTVQLAAAVQPLAQQQQPPLLTVLLNSPLALLGPAAPLGTGLPAAPTPQAIPIAPNLANTIDNTYLFVEPWVRYGFAVAQSIVRWIPYVGWFAGQIGVLYEFGESIVASGVFNFTDWLRGDGSFAENLVDFGVDVGLAFVWLGLDEAAQFFPLPPFCCYPPRPPLQGPFLAADTLGDPAETVEPMMAASLDESAPSGFDSPEATDELEQLGEDLTEEQGSSEDLSALEFEADATEDVVADEPDAEEAVDIDALAEEDSSEGTTDEDADDSAAQGQDATDGDTVDGEAAEQNAEGADDADSAEVEGAAE